MKYRIAWRSKLTGETGRGTTTFSKEEAEKIVRQSNIMQNRDRTNILHWYEPVPEAK